MATIRNAILKKRIDNVMSQLAVKTKTEMVYLSDDVTTLDGVLNRIDDNIEDIYSKLGSIDTEELTTQINEALDEFEAALNDTDDPNSIASQLSDLSDSIDAITNPSTGAAATAKAYTDTKLGLSGTEYADGTVKEYVDAVADDIRAANAGAFHYKGAVNYTNLLPVENVENGSVYQVRYRGTSGDDPLNAEYVYNGSEWEELGSIVDLSNYATSSAMASAINTAKQEAIDNTTNAISAVNTTINNMKDDSVTGSLANKIKANETAITALNDGTNGAEAKAKAYTDTKVSTVVGSVPAAVGDTNVANVIEYINAKVSKATQAANNSSGSAETNANLYTDEKIGTIPAKVGDTDTSDVISYVDAKALEAENNAKAAANTKIGTIPASVGETATATVVAYIDAKTAAVANDTSNISEAIGTIPAKVGDTDTDNVVEYIDAKVAQAITTANTSATAGDNAVKAIIGSGYDSSNTVAADVASVKTVIGAVPAKVGNTNTSNVVDYVNAKTAEVAASADELSDLIGTVPAKVGDTDTDDVIEYIDAKVAQAITTANTSATAGDNAVKAIIGSGYDSSNTVAADVASVKGSITTLSNTLGSGFDTTNTVKKYIGTYGQVGNATPTDLVDYIDKKVLAAQLDENGTSITETLETNIKSLLDTTGENFSFDSTNTVKKYIDDQDNSIKAIIGSGYSSSSTIATDIAGVKSSITTLTNTLGSGFTTTDTVKKYIDNKFGFKTIKIGSTEVVADSSTDTLTIEGTSSIQVTGDAENDKVTIAHGNSGVTAGTYGSATKVPVVTVDTKGHLTSVVETTIAGVTPASHAHGNITNDGKITATGVALATGDAFAIIDSSDSNSIKKTSIAIDTTKTTTYLRQDGTWATPPDTKYTHPASGVTAGTYGSATKTAKVTVDTNGHVTSAEEVTISGVTPASHAHGNITNDGKITATGVALATGDTFAVVDASDSNKIAKTSIAIDTTDTTKYLRHDGTWVVPTNTTYNNMGAASASAAGTAGLVPAPAAGKQNSFLRGDGTWVVPTDTKYTHPTYTAYTGKPTGNATPAFGGTVTISQVTSDATGHVTAMTDRTITIPSAVATSSANGLMPKGDKSKLDALVTFKTVAVGSTNVVADAVDDTLTFAGTSPITITGDATNDKVTIAHANSGATAGTYGSAAKVPVVTVNATGHVTAVSTANIATTLYTAASPTATTGNITITSASGYTYVDIFYGQGDNVGCVRGFLSSGVSNNIQLMDWTYDSTTEALTLTSAKAKISGTTLTITGDAFKIYRVVGYKF